MAAPDFAATDILVSPEIPLESGIVTFAIVLRNTGPDDANGVYFSTEWPLMGFLADTAGFDNAETNHEARKITTMLPLAAGAERRFGVRILTPRDSGGDSLTLAIHVAHFMSGTEHHDSRNVTIDTRLSTSGVNVGGFRITPAGIATSRC
jgi:hypothetical protein